MQRRNQLNQNAQKLAEVLPAWQAETVLQLLESLEKSERHNAALTEAISWAVSPERWIQREENIWEWRSSRRGDFLQILRKVITNSENSKGDHHDC